MAGRYRSDFFERPLAAHMAQATLRERRRRSIFRAVRFVVDFLALFGLMAIVYLFWIGTP